MGLGAVGAVCLLLGGCLLLAGPAIIKMQVFKVSGPGAADGGGAARGWACCCGCFARPSSPGAMRAAHRNGCFGAALPVCGILKISARINLGSAVLCSVAGGLGLPGTAILLSGGCALLTLTGDCCWEKRWMLFANCMGKLVLVDCSLLSRTAWVMRCSARMESLPCAWCGV